MFAKVGRIVEQLEPGLQIRSLTTRPPIAIAVQMKTRNLASHTSSAPATSRWQANLGAAGFLAVRHPAYGAHLTLSVGLPEAIVHIAAAHSMHA